MFVFLFRSTGLMIHMTAYSIDPGWIGNILLEMFNAGKFTFLILRPKIKIAALNFEMPMRSVLHPCCSLYEAKYKMQFGVVCTKSHEKRTIILLKTCTLCILYIMFSCNIQKKTVYNIYFYV